MTLYAVSSDVRGRGSANMGAEGKGDGRTVRLSLAVSLFVVFALSMGYMSAWPNPWTGTSYVARRAGYASASTPASAQSKATGYTFWSSDFHIAPIADLKDLFEPMGMTVIDKSLSLHCKLMGTCQTDLKVLNFTNGIDLGKCPNQLKREFFEAYKNNPEMSRVDAFLCNHAASMCEVFMPFNKPLVVIASTRYEIGRHSAERWAIWNDNLRRIAANPRNVVAANNWYDFSYIKYFTGIENVHLLPNNCGYVKARYNPTRLEILVGPGRAVNKHLFEGLASEGQKHNITFSRVRDLYAKYDYADLAQHRAVVLIPYQVSIMSIFEYYRMAIPIFAPSVDLLTDWIMKYRIMPERTWAGFRKRKVINTKSAVPRHPSVLLVHDPNNDKDPEAIKYWLRSSDFYAWPHIQTFNSWDDLIGKLQAADLDAISQEMKVHNKEVRADLLEKWQGHFRRMFEGVPPAVQQPRAQEQDFDAALKSGYGVTLKGCVGQEESR